MPKKGKRRSSKKDVAPGDETDKVEELVQKNQSTQGKTEKTHKSVDEDDNLYDQEMSDDSDVNNDEVPWAKKATASKNIQASEDTSKSQESKSHTTNSSLNKLSNTAIPKKIKALLNEAEQEVDNDISNTIPKKNRDIEASVTELSAATIPKKRRQMEDEYVDTTPDSNALKSNETKSSEHFNRNIEQNEIIMTSVTSGNKIPSSIQPLRRTIVMTEEVKDSQTKGSSYQTHVVDKSSLPRSNQQNPIITEAIPEPTPSIVNEQTDDLRKDINRLIELVYKDRDRTRTTPLETVDMFGSFLSRSITESMDYFDRDEKGNIVNQPKIPIFPEDFTQGQKPFPLSWWGIIAPSEKVLSYHYPTEPPPMVSQTQHDPTMVDIVMNPMDHPRHPIHHDRRHVGPMTSYERDRMGPHPHGLYHPNAFPPMYGQHPGWGSHYPPSYGGPPMYPRPSGNIRPAVGPDWQSNMRDERWNNNNMDRPHR